VCRGRPAAHGHHVYKQQWLRSWHRSFGKLPGAPSLKQLLSDTRNRLPVCLDCNVGHEDGRRMPYDVAVTPDVRAFVGELVRVSRCDAPFVRLERDYPR
jgi:hypothetical protein